MTASDHPLAYLGWNDYFEAQYVSSDLDGVVPARVTGHHRTEYVIMGVEGEVRAVIAGKMHLTAEHGDLPAVGDWVLAEEVSGDGVARIRTVLPRKSKFSRRAAGVETEEQVLAANIDTAFWVTSLNDVFNPRRIERFIAAVWDSGAAPAVLLNKSDLATPDIVANSIHTLAEIAPGVPVHALTAVEGEGLEELSQYLAPGKTVVFLGMSGVGKSTIVNGLFGGERQKTSAIRETDNRGRHTTTTRELFMLPGGGMVIDTPGIRELQLWDNPEAVMESFGDIEELAADCRFMDCRHETEPGCAVKEAVESGTISRGHFENYLKLRHEVDRLESQKHIRGRIEEKRRQRQFGRMVKSFKKTIPKRGFEG